MKKKTMKTFYRVTTKESEILFKTRKISKAYRRWLRENDISYTSDFFTHRYE